MAWQTETDLRCPGCGLPRDVTMDPESEGQWVAHPLRCHACSERGRAARGYTDTVGLYLPVVKDEH